MKPLRDFLVFCAGVDRELLVNCPLYERHKHTGIGITVFFTGVFAAMAGGYSLYTVFRSLPIAVILGLVWGFFILNIDRLILSTMQKGSGFWREFLHALPRLILAALIAFTVAHPFKLRLFQDETLQHLTSERLQQRERIQAEFEDKRKKYQEQMQELTDSSPLLRNIQGLENQVRILKSEQKDCEDRREEARKYYLCECAGTCGTMIRGDGPECERNREEYMNISAECARKGEISQREIEVLDRKLSAARDEVSHHVKTIEEQRGQEIERLRREHDKSLENVEESFSTSFLARSEALSGLSEQRPTTWMIGFFLTLLILAVEIMPVLVKLISPFDVFDALLNSVRRQYLQSIDQLATELFEGRATERGFETEPTSSFTPTPTDAQEEPMRPTRRQRHILLAICTAMVTTGVTYYYTKDWETAFGGGSFFLTILIAYLGHGESRASLA